MVSMVARSSVRICPIVLTARYRCRRDRWWISPQRSHNLGTLVAIVSPHYCNYTAGDPLFTRSLFPLMDMSLVVCLFLKPLVNNDQSPDITMRGAMVTSSTLRGCASLMTTSHKDVVDPYKPITDDKVRIISDTQQSGSALSRISVSS